MKIIKPGKIEKLTQRFECNRCSCIYECEEGEYKIDGIYPTVCSSRCPECGALVIIA